MGNKMNNNKMNNNKMNNKKTLKPETIKKRLRSIRLQIDEVKVNYNNQLRELRKEQHHLIKRCPHVWGQVYYGIYEIPYRFCTICGVEDV